MPMFTAQSKKTQVQFTVKIQIHSCHNCPFYYCCFEEMLYFMGLFSEIQRVVGFVTQL